MKPKPKKKLSPVYRMLERHKDSCMYWIFSGPRHCTCGKEQADAAIARVRELLGEPLATQVLGKSG